MCVCIYINACACTCVCDNAMSVDAEGKESSSGCSYYDRTISACRAPRVDAVTECLSVPARKKKKKQANRKRLIGAPSADEFPPTLGINSAISC